MQLDKELFFHLIRLGIGNTKALLLPNKVDWSKLEVLANQQGLSAVIVDGIEKLPESQRPPKPVLLQWIGETLQGFEYRFELYRRVIGELASFYNQHGIKMMLVKGYACSINWPRPEHRPCGDIDIWLYGKQREADELIAKEKDIKVDTSHHHHTVFEWEGFSVENHYDFVNLYGHKSSAELEKIFKELGQDDTNFVELNGEKVYLPSPNLHALFLIRHMVSHFAGSNITLRQVLDWAFYVEKYSKLIDWVWLEGILDKFHMIDFYNCINAICVEDLGFDVSLFYCLQFDPQIKDRIISDTLYPKYVEEAPSNLITRIVFKYTRWKANAWKQKLCYDENRWTIFWRGVWSHLLKPNSI